MATAERGVQFSEEPPGVDDRVRRFRLGDEVDTFAIRTERLLVVVDTLSTPADARRLRAAIAADVAGRTLLVVDTHADYDHAWGNSVFADVPIIGHARCGERLPGAEACGRHRALVGRDAGPVRRGGGDAALDPARRRRASCSTAATSRSS